MKLKHANQNYFEHFSKAILFSFISFMSGFALFIHAIFPFLFKHTGTKNFLWMIRQHHKNTTGLNDHIQIRYNTKSTDELFPWRVVVNGKEQLAQDVLILGNAYGEKTYLDNVAKYNLAIDGVVVWTRNNAVIISKG